MKKFIQISLVFVLVWALFQAAAYAPAGLAGKISSNMGRNASTGSNAAVQSVQASVCLGLKGVICIQPNVGWNS